MNFRNFKKIEFSITNLSTLIFGRNSLGKTNLLEGINFLLTGEGFKNSKDEELINFENNYAIVEGIISKMKENIHLKITLLKDDKGILRKDLFINGIKKAKNLYLKEVIPIVIFSPEQLEIVNGPPEKRRDYFNKILSITDSVYKTKLNNYLQALKKRNKILEIVKDVNKLKEQLFFWNNYLVDNGLYLLKKREEYINYLNMNNKLKDKFFGVKYLKKKINNNIFKENFLKEVRIKKTLIGPHKDDFIFFSKDNNVNLFGSRSEERLVLFWLKLNELKFYENYFKNRPLLLLDDIFSELDDFNKSFILSLLKNYQSIITYTNKEILELINFSNQTSYNTIDL